MTYSPCDAPTIKICYIINDHSRASSNIPRCRNNRKNRDKFNLHFAKALSGLSI